MAPNTKIKKACKAMKNLGYSEKIVKSVLKELLKLYEKDWTLIEEDNYGVLLDAILESEEQKALNNELEHRNTEDEVEENEPPLKRSKLSSQKNQSSTSFQPENQSYGKQNRDESLSGKHQDKDFKSNAPCVSKYRPGKRKSRNSRVSLKLVEHEKETNFISHDESDEPRSPLEHLESSGGQSNVHHGFSEKKVITYKRRNHTHFFKEKSKLHLHDDDDDLALEEKEFGAYMDEADFESEPLPLSYDLPSFSDSPDPPRRLLQGSSDEICPDVRENCSILPEVIDLDAEDTSSTHSLLPIDAYSMGNCSGIEGNSTKLVNYRQSEAGKSLINAQRSLKLDIASSSTGEVKIYLMVESSPRSDFRVPSLESVLKQVEDQCLRSYRIPSTGFSILTLMKDVCECFLATGTTSTPSEKVGPTNVVSSLGIPGNIYSETNDHQLSLCSTISNDPITTQNLVGVSPQIPRFVGSLHLDFSRCRIYLNVDLNNFSEIERNIMELNRIEPSSSRLIIDRKCCYHYIGDITKGLEASEISLINEIDEEQGPKFNYIPQNVVHKNAHVRFPLARISEDNCCSNCFEDCLSLVIPCTCAGKSEREFAYTRDCLLKEKFLDYFTSIDHSPEKQNLFYCQDCPLERCKGNIFSRKCNGHVVRKFVKECWYKCGCSKKCGNRVVQRGITAKLQVFRTPEQKGWGVRTLEEIPRGAFICEYVGEVITNRESFERSMQITGDNLTYPVLLDSDWSSKTVLKDEEALCLDSTVYGNVARFINHRCCDANMVEVPVEVETPDHNYYHLAFFTTRKVNALEELTWDYGMDFSDNHPAKAFKCLCGSKFCRDHRSLKRSLNLGD